MAKAVEWLAHRRRAGTVLDERFLRRVHRRMFDGTWAWAGRSRRSEKSVGITPSQIPDALRNLLADTVHWIEHQTYPVDELAARFHHRLVQIHLFPNGNGRHARLMTDLLLEQLGTPRFTWGSGDLDADGGVRARYLGALRSADKGSIAELLRFVRS